VKQYVPRNTYRKQYEYHIFTQMGRKRNIHHTCKCGKPTASPNTGYCNDCRNAYQRANRKSHSELSPEQRIKANARSYLNVYIRRGLVEKKPCCICGDINAQAHHEDYSKPLEVIWYCKKHHHLHHKPDYKEPEIVDRERSPKGEHKISCSKCDKPAREGGRYCDEHHAENMRESRGKQKLKNKLK
jgi:hypothetical protein